MSPEIMSLLSEHPFSTLFMILMVICAVLLWAVCASARLDESCFPEEMEGREDCYTCKHSGDADDPMCERCSAREVKHFSNWESKA